MRVCVTLSTNFAFVYIFEHVPTTRVSYCVTGELKTRMVLIIDKVREVFPSKDSKVRNVRVKTSCGKYERPINRIAVIYPEEGYKQ